MSEDEKLTVRVEAINDDGRRTFAFGSGFDTSEAVEDALAWLRDETGDDSYVMNEWWAA